MCIREGIGIEGERQKKGERTQLHNDEREIDFRDEQHTHAHA
jgi:hypothetical protein